MRRAAVDIGTNSVRLLIVGEDGEEVIRRETVTGLGRGVDSQGRFDPVAVATTLDALAGYGDLIRGNSVDVARAVATSATRDAADRAEFLVQAGGVLGFLPEVISGEEEGALSLAGAASGLPEEGELLVVDVGGGSTEFVRSGEVISIDIGSVRLTERHLPDRPAGFDQLESAVQECRSAFAGVEVASTDCPVVGVAGTWTSLAALESGLDHYDRGVVHHFRLHRTDLDRLVLKLARLSIAETAALGALDPGRAPVILAGAVVARAAMRALGAEHVTVSEKDLLDGMVAGLGA